MDIFGLLEKSHQQWTEDDLSHKINLTPRFIRKHSSSESDEEKDEKDEKKDEVISHPDDKIFKAQIKRQLMENERRYSIMKKCEDASNRLTQIKTAKVEKSKRRQAVYDTRLQSLSKTRSGRYGMRQLQTQHSNNFDGDNHEDYFASLHPYQDKKDEGAAIYSPLSPTRVSYLERINMIKAKEKWQVERLSSSLERKLERARANAAKKLQSRQLKAREEVQHAHEVHHKLKENTLSPRRANVHVYAKEHDRNILLSSDEKLKRAVEHATLQLQSRREKAREEVKHAQEIARRVRAAKLLQNIFRAKIIQPSLINTPNSTGINRSALKQLRKWDAWKYHLISKRLLSSKIDHEWKKCLETDLEFLISATGTTLCKPITSFDCLGQKLSDSILLKTTNNFLEEFSPVLRNYEISTKQFLCATLLSAYPEEVIGKHVAGNIQNLLKKRSDRLIHTLNTIIVAQPENKAAAVKAFVPSLLSFLSIFGQWKQDDLNGLVSSLKEDAIESWVIYLTSVEALDYYSIKEKNISPSRTNNMASIRDEGLYQYKLRYEEAKKGSQTHIKRIRVMLNRLLGDKEGFNTMKEMKEIAMKQMNKDGSLQRVRDDADIISRQVTHIERTIDESASSCQVPHVERPTDESSSVIDPQKLDGSLQKISQSFSMTNIQLVHQVLLSDIQDWFKDSHGGDDSYLLNDCEFFFSSWCNDFKTVLDHVGHLTMEEKIKRTFHKAFFDKMLHDLKNADLTSTRSLIITLIESVSRLVSNSTSFQQKFERLKICILSSGSELEILRELHEVGHLLSLLESPARSHSTSRWCAITHSYLSRTSEVLPLSMKTVAEYILISTIYLLKKTEVCHVEVMKFQFAVITPIIHHHGASYERGEFQKSFLHGDSFQLSDLTATRTWIQKMQSDFIQYPAQIEIILRGRGFVDEIVFARSSMSLPEVLYLDNDHISRIRCISKCCVIVSALFLHGCNLCGVRSNQADSHNRSMEVTMRIKEIFSILADCRDPETIERMILIMISIVEAVAGREMDTRTIQQFRNYATVVLNGEDKVMKLLDNRIRNFFKSACLFQATGIPTSMVTGNKCISSDSSTKSSFKTSVSREAIKAGFGICVDELVEAGYLAYRVMDLSLQLYKQHVFIPLVNELCENPSV